jgi:choline kinase
VRAIILAAGRGLRLKQPLDTEVPKCLLQFGGRTLLERHLQLLKNAGVEEVFLALVYLYESVEAHLKSLGRNPRPEIVLNPRFELGSVRTLHTAADAMTRGSGRAGLPQEEAVRDLLGRFSHSFEIAEMTGIPWIETDYPPDLERAARAMRPQL